MVDLSLIDKQFWELVQRYPTLHLEYRDGKNIVTGHLIFSANYQFQQINDDYLLEMVIPNNYPDSLPSVKDKANRIVGGFHKYTDGTLCLGASLALRLNYSKQPSLLGFIEKCVCLMFSALTSPGNLPGLSTTIRLSKSLICISVPRML